MAAFEEKKQELADLGVKIFAASVDSEEHTAEVAQSGISFPLGYGVTRDDVKALGQEERALLRKHGVRFGQHNIFMPLLLKPAPTRLRLILWSLWEGFEVFPEAPPPGLLSFRTTPLILG